MKILIAGLGRMGMQIARKLIEGEHSVVAYNRSSEPVAQAAGFGALAAHTKPQAVKAFGEGRLILWLMIPSDAIESELADWLKLIPQGSVVVDGGNSDFRLTKKHAQLVESKGSKLVDVGTSGGIWGYKNGFSMMVGGDVEAFEAIEPCLKTLARPTGAYRHFGPTGAGHYVKMVHNAIEYGMMESLAEGYRMLKDGPYRKLDLAAAGEVWQRASVVQSWLNELARQALAENPELDGVDGFVAESGEARWALEVSKQTGIPMPAIQASFDVRLASQKGQTNFATKLLAAIRNKFGGHALNKDSHGS